MRLVTMLCFFLASVSTWAGTFIDDFNDGDWDGWTAVATLVWDTDVADIVSIDDGILKLDHINKPGFTLSLSIYEDWEDYSFSADMRLLGFEPGGH